MGGGDGGDGWDGEVVRVRGEDEDGLGGWRVWMDG